MKCECCVFKSKENKKEKKINRPTVERCVCWARAIRHRNTTEYSIRRGGVEM